VRCPDGEELELRHMQVGERMRFWPPSACMGPDGQRSPRPFERLGSPRCPNGKAGADRPARKPMNLSSFVITDMVSAKMATRTSQEAIETIVSTLCSRRAPKAKREILAAILSRENSDWRRGRRFRTLEWRTCARRGSPSTRRRSFGGSTHAAPHQDRQGTSGYPRTRQRPRPAPPRRTRRASSMLHPFGQFLHRLWRSVQPHGNGAGTMPTGGDRDPG
jgi:hypothetical protein